MLPAVHPDTGHQFWDKLHLPGPQKQAGSGNATPPTPRLTIECDASMSSLADLADHNGSVFCSVAGCSAGPPPGREPLWSGIRARKVTGSYPHTGNADDDPHPSVAERANPGEGGPGRRGSSPLSPGLLLLPVTLQLEPHCILCQNSWGGEGTVRAGSGELCAGAPEGEWQQAQRRVTGPLAACEYSPSAAREQGQARCPLSHGPFRLQHWLACVQSLGSGPWASAQQAGLGGRAEQQEPTVRCPEQI